MNVSQEFPAAPLLFDTVMVWLPVWPVEHQCCQFCPVEHQFCQFCPVEHQFCQFCPVDHQVCQFCQPTVRRPTLKLCSGGFRTHPGQRIAAAAAGSAPGPAAPGQPSAGPPGSLSAAAPDDSPRCRPPGPGWCCTPAGNGHSNFLILDKTIAHSQYRTRGGGRCRDYEDNDIDDMQLYEDAGTRGRMASSQ